MKHVYPSHKCYYSIIHIEDKNNITIIPSEIGLLTNLNTFVMGKVNYYIEFCSRCSMISN